ncbi:restriction endonuclease subunit S [Escherichia coli]|uniref:restriction endonuclease subunit S n=1 Tax=Escherichia coli TaxID=562 RepID=UPI001BC8658C|nr:restriction endonuclease subunit S [Escherichia coli]
MIVKPLIELSKKISSGLTPLRSNPEFWDNGTIPWLKTEQLGEKYIYETNEHISEVALEKTAIRLFPVNSLSIAMYGEGKTRGNLSILKKSMATNQACCNVEIDSDKADYEYVYYFLKTQYDELRQLSSGVRKNLNSNDIKNYPIRLPSSLDEQRKIACVLKVLDDKLALNNRINAELEAMAKTLYDYWFVQFDFPDADGKPYKTSGGKMEYNATLKREIPAGWNDSILGKFIELDRGVTYSKEDVRTQDDKDTIGILRATNVTGNNVDIDDLVFIPSSRVNVNQMLNKFDILIVMSSGSKEHVGKNGVYYFEKKHAFGAFCSKITPVRKYRYFINTFLQSKWFKSYINNQCLGTNINNLTNTHITNCEIICPTPDVVALFEK